MFGSPALSLAAMLTVALVGAANGKEAAPHRRLTSECDGSSDGEYFDFLVDAEVDGDDIADCDASDLVEIGEAVNFEFMKLFREDSLVLSSHTEICAVPEERRRRNLRAADEAGKERELKQWGFTYKGGGKCRSCFEDNKDGRLLTEENSWDDFKASFEDLLDHDIPAYIKDYFYHRKGHCLYHKGATTWTVTLEQTKTAPATNCPH